MNLAKLKSNRKKIAELKAENKELSANLYRGLAETQEAIDFNTDWIGSMELANDAYTKTIKRMYR